MVLGRLWSRDASPGAGRFSAPAPAIGQSDFPERLIGSLARELANILDFSRKVDDRHTKPVRDPISERGIGMCSDKMSDFHGGGEQQDRHGEIIAPLAGKSEVGQGGERAENDDAGPAGAQTEFADVSHRALPWTGKHHRRGEYAS